VNTAARRQRALERAELRDRWLRSGHRPAMPDLPFGLRQAGAALACGACGRTIRPGSRYVDARAAAGRPRTLLCLSCARRTLLEWSDERRREAVAARRLTSELAIAPLADTTAAAA
jgi:hypothetical protein